MKSSLLYYQVYVLGLRMSPPTDHGNRQAGRRGALKARDQAGRPSISKHLLKPQSRFGDKPLKFQVVRPQNGTAVVKGLKHVQRGGKPHGYVYMAMPSLRDKYRRTPVRGKGTKHKTTGTYVRIIRR